MPHFLALREALNRYADALVFAAMPDAKQNFEKSLAELAQHLESYAKQPNADDAIAIGKELGWLEKYGQAKELVGGRAPALLASQSVRAVVRGDAEDRGSRTTSTRKCPFTR